MIFVEVIPLFQTISISMAHDWHRLHSRFTKFVCECQIDSDVQVIIHFLRLKIYFDHNISFEFDSMYQEGPMSNKTVQ
jgi:hypothetical protein